LVLVTLLEWISQETIFPGLPSSSTGLTLELLAEPHVMQPMGVIFMRTIFATTILLVRVG
jgi:hypothetical protein